MSSNYASVEKKYKDNIYYTAAGASTSAMSVNIDRQSYKYTSKRLTLKRPLRKSSFE